MKKSLVTLAVVGAFAGAASAQSSVTVYGAVDMGITKATSGTAGTANSGLAGQFVNANNGVGTAGIWGVQQGRASRLGFKGQEDLGGGLYASFDIQHRFFPDTGTQAGPVFWTARSVVALGSSTLGEIYLGRDFTPAVWVALGADPSGWNYVSQISTSYTYGGYSGSVASDASAFRKSNTVGYRSPNLGGFSTELAVAAGEGTRKKTVGANAQYRAGPIWAGAGYDGVDGDNRLFVLAGSYAFGIVKPIISYSNAKGGVAPTVTANSLGSVSGLVTSSASTAFGGAVRANYIGKNFSLGASLDLGLGRLYFGGARLKVEDSVVGSTGKFTKLLAGYEYRMSKRTTLYTNVGSVNGDYNGTKYSRNTAIDIGVNHAF